MDVFVARQPVLDRNKKTSGYELLLRGGMTNVFPDIDGDTATSKVLSNTFLSIGMENITSGKKAFINFTEELLIKKIPLLFPPDKIIVEVLEDVEPLETVIEACKEMVDKGYDLALDGTGHLADFLTLASEYETGYWNGIPEMAQKIGVDLEQLPELYMDAVGWADSLANAQ